MGNVFALLGLRALFVLVESLVARFRYLDETIAVVLGLVGVKLLIEDLVKIGPVASLALIFAAFAIGIVLVDPRRQARSRRRGEARGAGAGDEGRRLVGAAPWPAGAHTSGMSAPVVGLRPSGCSSARSRPGDAAVHPLGAARRARRGRGDRRAGRR